MQLPQIALFSNFRALCAPTQYSIPPNVNLVLRIVRRVVCLILNRIRQFYTFEYSQMYNLNPFLYFMAPVHTQHSDLKSRKKFNLGKPESLKAQNQCTNFLKFV